MAEHESPGRELSNWAKQLALDVAAVVVGLILMVIGLGMGVTVVLLPVGIAVGFAGIFAVLWGLFGRSAAKAGPAQPPGSR